MDVHIPFAITSELRLRDIDVLTAQADNAARFSDPELLRRCAELERVLFSQDSDLLKVASGWQRSHTSFAGLVYAHQLRIGIGQCVVDLAGDPRPDRIGSPSSVRSWTRRSFAEHVRSPGRARSAMEIPQRSESSAQIQNSI
jgi:hypothetical protein